MEVAMKDFDHRYNWPRAKLIGELADAELKAARLANRLSNEHKALNAAGVSFRHSYDSMIHAQTRDQWFIDGVNLPIPDPVMPEEFVLTEVEPKPITYTAQEVVIWAMTSSLLTGCLSILGTLAIH